MECSEAGRSQQEPCEQDLIQKRSCERDDLRQQQLRGLRQQQHPGLAHVRILTDSGTVSASSGLLATLCIDTTGIDSGTYTLSLGNTLNGPTAFLANTGEVPISITEGTLTVVPEPTGLALLATVFVPLLRRNHVARR